MLCVFYLRNFVTSPISQTALNLFQQQMNTVRQAGLKAIVRFAYNDNNSPVDATPSMVNTHLTQLAPYLAANKDVITVVQAGMIGSWGEWGNTNNYGDSYNMTAQNQADRKSVVDKLLAVVPAERMVQLRMPLFKTKLYSPTALSAAEALPVAPRPAWATTTIASCRLVGLRHLCQSIGGIPVSGGRHQLCTGRRRDLQLRPDAQRLPERRGRNGQVPLVVPEPGLQHHGAQQLAQPGLLRPGRTKTRLSLRHEERRLFGHGQAGRWFRGQPAGAEHGLGCAVQARDVELVFRNTASGPTA